MRFIDLQIILILRDVRQLHLATLFDQERNPPALCLQTFFFFFFAEIHIANFGLILKAYSVT